jgi:hypothetical protein
MANQYTKAEGEGKPKPKGANQFTSGKRENHDPETRDKMRAGHAAQKLQSILDDPDSTKDQIIAACKALMPYGKSTYASVLEHKMEAPVDEQETMARLTHLFSSNPGLLKPLIDADPGLRAAIKSMIEGQPAVVDARQTPKQAA